MIGKTAQQVLIAHQFGFNQQSERESFGMG